MRSVPSFFRLRSAAMGDPLGAAAAMALVGHRPELGRDDHVVAPAAEGGAEQLFGAPLAVHVRGVEEVHTGVDRRVDHGLGRLGTDPATEVVAAEADDRNRQLTDRPLLHRHSLARRYRGRVRPTERFVELIQEHPVADEQTLLSVAAHDHDLDDTVWLGRLDELSADVKEPTLEALRTHLFDVEGFAGDTEDYHVPENSFLDSVIDRRLGMPITLAAVTIEVGRRAGVQLDGIGMPGHFLVLRPHRPDRVSSTRSTGAAASTRWGALPCSNGRTRAGRGVTTSSRRLRQRRSSAAVPFEPPEQLPCPAAKA